MVAGRVTPIILWGSYVSSICLTQKLTSLRKSCKLSPTRTPVGYYAGIKIILERKRRVLQELQHFHT